MPEDRPRAVLAGARTVARHALPLVALVTVAGGPYNVVTSAAVSAGMLVMTSAMTASVFVLYHPTLLLTVVAVHLAVVLVVAVRLHRRLSPLASPARLLGWASWRVGRREGRALFVVLFPTAVLLALVIQPRMLAALLCAGVAISVGHRVFRGGRTVGSILERPFTAASFAAGFLVLADLWRATLYPPHPPDPGLRSLSEVPVYDVQVDAQRQAVYFSFSSSSAYRSAYTSESFGLYATGRQGLYGRIDLLTGVITQTTAPLHKAQRFELAGERQQLVGFDVFRDDPRLYAFDLDTLDEEVSVPLINADCMDVVVPPGEEAAYLVAEFHNELYRYDFDAGAWTTYPLSSPVGSAYDLQYVATQDAFYISQWGPYGLYVNRVGRAELAAPAGPVGTHRFVGVWMAGVAIDTEHNRLFVARPLHGRIDVLALDTLAPLYELHGSSLIREIAYDARRDQVYGLQFVPGRLDVFDASGGTPMASYRTPGFGRALAYDAELDALFIGTAAGVHRVPPWWYGGG